MTTYKLETECATNESPLGIMDDVYMTTIHLDPDNKAYGYGESPKESVEDSIRQLAFTLTLDDKDTYHGFRVSRLPKHLQPLMIEQLKRRNIQLQKRTVNITCMIGEWQNDVQG